MSPTFGEVVLAVVGTTSATSTIGIKVAIERASSGLMKVVIFHGQLDICSLTISAGNC